MAVWDELKVILARLRVAQPGAVEASAPGLDEDQGGLAGGPAPHPPFAVWLAS